MTINNQSSVTLNVYEKNLLKNSSEKFLEPANKVLCIRALEGSSIIYFKKDRIEIVNRGKIFVKQIQKHDKNGEVVFVVSNN